MSICISIAQARAKSSSAFWLTMHIVPYLPRKSSGAQAAPEGGGRTSDPLVVHIVPYLPRKSDRSLGSTRGTRGYTSDPLVICIIPRLPHKSSGAQARAYIRPLGSGHCTTPPTQKRPQPKRRQRDTRTYIRPIGSGHCPTPAAQKRPEPKRH